MYINLNTVTNFFKPNRQVWGGIDGYTGGNLDSDADSDSDVDNFDADDSDDNSETLDTEGNLEKLLGVSENQDTYQFVKQARETCDSAKTEGAEQHVCSLREINQLQELLYIEKFIDTLYYKLLVQGEGAKKLKDTFARFQALKDVCNMDRVMEQLEKAESYEIRTYSDSQIARADEYPNRKTVLRDKIVFTYEDGSRKAINLEMNLNPPVIDMPIKEEEDEKYEEAQGAETIGDKMENYTSDVLDSIFYPPDPNMSGAFPPMSVWNMWKNASKGAEDQNEYEDDEE